MGIDDDQFDRQKRIANWNQNKIESVKAVVVGAGALGNEVVKNLLQLGVCKLSIIDFDTVAKANLNRCVLFTAGDAEKVALKAKVLAQRAKRINKNALAKAVIKNVEKLDEKYFSKFDVVFGCLDNLGARLHVNANCYEKTPLIDGGTTGFMGKVQVVQAPSSCIECSMYKQDYTFLWRKYSCTGEGLNIIDPKMPALPTTTSVIAGVQVNEFLKLTQPEIGKTLTGKYFFYNGLTGESKIYEVKKRETCPVH